MTLGFALKLLGLILEVARYIATFVDRAQLAAAERRGEVSGEMKAYFLLRETQDAMVAGASSAAAGELPDDQTDPDNRDGPSGAT